LSRIHATAVVESGAEIDPTAEIGAYAVVGPHVRLAAGVVLRPHAYVTGQTEIGPETEVFSFASVGEIPQDKKYHGEPTHLAIGAHNRIREHATIHLGTAQGGGLTSIGDDNLIMVGAHVGHDCQIGSHTIIANNVALAGHVIVEDHALLGGMSAVHQFARIGESALLMPYGGASLDVPPYTRAHGNHCRLMGVHRINLERRGFSKERIEVIERAYRIIFRSKLRPEEAFARVREELPDSADAEHLVAFLEKSERGFCRIR
jgi:UDP-N-acetylglucosamine acyltransferase